MNLFSKIFASLMLISAVALPIAASRGGWGIPNETNQRIVNEVRNHCPRLDSTGKCIIGHRSYYGRRSHLGGGPRSGK